MKRKIMFFLLIVVDQLIKCIIYFNFMQNNFTLLYKKVGFVPYLNKDQLSIFNNEMNLNLSLSTLIIINLGAIILLILTYKFIKKREYTNYHYENAFLLITVGVVCSLIDKLTLGGSLDYILFYRHIHDLKDIYLYIGVIFIVIYLIYCLKHDKKKTHIKMS